MVENTQDIIVAALYKFVALPDFAARRGAAFAVCRDHDVLGTLLLAPEGFNGTLAGPPAGIAAVLAHLRRFPGCADLQYKQSAASKNPFLRLKVRLKKEIVSLGVAGIDPNAAVGTYVAPNDWNDLIADPDVVVIDTRNDYEVAIGSFAGAIDPKTPTFRDFPAWFRDNREGFRGKKFAMFCTGGIRCEKSTAFLKAEGIAEVYHLQGGILKYLEQVPAAESLWQGECFVFDQRVSLSHGLAPGSFGICYCCRLPLSVADRASKNYLEGIACPHCYDRQDSRQRQRFAERQRQVDLARRRGEKHVGGSAP